MQYVYAVIFFVLGMVLNTTSASGQICPQVQSTFPQAVMDLMDTTRPPHARSTSGLMRESYSYVYATASWWNTSEDGCEEMNHGVNLLVRPDGSGDISIFGSAQNHCQGTWSHYYGITNDLSTSFVDFKNGQSHIETTDLAVDENWGDESSLITTRGYRTAEVNIKQSSDHVGRSRTSSFWSHPTGETYSYSTRGRWVIAEEDGVIMQDSVILESGGASTANIGEYRGSNKQLR